MKSAVSRNVLEYRNSQQDLKDSSYRERERQLAPESVVSYKPT